MKKLLMIVSILALVMLIAPPIGVFLGKMEIQTSKNWMLAATLLWFATAPFWMGKNS